MFSDGNDEVDVRLRTPCRLRITLAIITKHQQIWCKMSN